MTRSVENKERQCEATVKAGNEESSVRQCQVPAMTECNNIRETAVIGFRPSGDQGSYTMCQETKGREVAIQANEFEIERKASHLPARKRYIPLKLGDYRIYAGETQLKCKEEAEEAYEEEDATYDPDEKVSKAPKAPVLRGRGRPRKYNVQGESNHSNEGSEKKPTIVRVSSGFKCNLCSRIFTLRGNAKVHLITHTDQKPFACTFESCDKRMRTKESLRRHQLSHLGVRLFGCPSCNRKFSSNSSLQEHLSRHTGDKPLTCEICGAKFRQSAVLKRHIIVHSSEKPFSCGVCGKRFAMKVYLQSHMKSHTGERPFKCEICGKYFAHASDVNRHKNIHTGKKQYPCSMCSMRYSDVSSKRRHEKEHQSSQKFSCHQCGRQFPRAGQLRGHLMKEHDSLVYKLEVNSSVPATPGTPSDRPPLDQTVMKVSLNDQPGSSTKQASEIFPTQGDHSSVVCYKPITLVDNLSDLQHSHTIQIVDQDSQSNRQVYECQLAEIITLDDLDNQHSQDDEKNSTKDVVSSFRLVRNGDNTFTVIQQSTSELPGQSAENYPEWQLDGMTYRQLPADEEIAICNELQDVATAGSLPVAVDYTGEKELELTSNVDRNYLEDKSSMNTLKELDHASLKKVKPSELYPNSPGSKVVDYLYSPDFDSQEYYNWLSAFTEQCKLLTVPLDKNVFQQISHLQKLLTDFMATPSGVIADKNNFRVLRGITRDLTDITGNHLDYMLNYLP